MADESPFGFEDLKNLSDTHRRGYRFESFVASLFQKEHFSVKPNPSSAKPRQVDLLASLDNETYLIETKWRKNAANIDDIDSLFTRLETVPASVCGLLVSYSGFTRQAIDRVTERASRPVLLINGAEIQRLVDSDGSLRRLLYQKRSALLVHRQVIFESDHGTAREGKTSKTTPKGTGVNAKWRILDAKGDRSKWFVSKGEIDGFIFVEYLPGSGGLNREDSYLVTADIALPVTHEEGIVRLIRHLSDLGWATTDAHWNIQQETRNWHGIGAEEFVETLTNWRSRYKGLRLHHSEQICYTDECEGGYYTLDAYVSAREERKTRHMPVLTFQLTGFPLDAGPLRHLCESFGVSEPVFLRPIKEPPAAGHQIEGRHNLEIAAYLVERKDFYDGEGETDIVSGVVARNPYYVERYEANASYPEWLPRELLHSEHLFCYLSSGHRLNETDIIYRLEGIESVLAYNALLVRCTIDYYPKPYQRKSQSYQKPSNDGDIGKSHARTFAEIKPEFTQFSPGWPEDSD